MQLVTRAEWGARAPRSVQRLDYATQKGTAVHWEGPNMGQFAHGVCAGKVRGIQAFHMDSRGWVDIAYNFVVCPHGYVFEGRGWGVRSAANGTNDSNAAYHAICYLSGQGDAFTEVAKGAYNELFYEWARRYGRQPDIRPHSHFFQTACPGDEIRRWLSVGHPSTVSQGVTPMYNPPIGPIAAVWQDEAGKVIAGASPNGDVYAWGCKWVGNVNGKPYWGDRKVAQIGPRTDGQEGYMITATSGERYQLPDGIDKL